MHHVSRTPLHRTPYWRSINVQADTWAGSLAASRRLTYVRACVCESASWPLSHLQSPDFLSAGLQIQPSPSTSTSAHTGPRKSVCAALSSTRYINQYFMCLTDEL